jgi:hypothetical protein
MWTKTLMGLLIVFVTSSVPADASGQDFVPVPAGSVVVTPAGDTVAWNHNGYLVSDSAAVRMDRALRQSRENESTLTQNLAVREQQLALLVEANDSLKVAMAEDKAWRDLATRQLEQYNVGWVEKILWGVGGAVLGYAAGISP